MKKFIILFATLSMLIPGAQACGDNGGTDTGTVEPGPDPKPDPDPDPDPDPEPEVFMKYYVAENGGGSVDGTIEHPFQSINEALAVAEPGDTVFVRGGTYREQVFFPKSGNDEHRIVLKAYEGETPVITGEGLTWNERSTQLVLISGVSHITLEGFEIANLYTDTAEKEVNGITVNAGATNISLLGNHVHHIQNTAPRDNYPGAHAIHIIGNTDKALRNIVVDGNEVHDCVTGTSESVTINGYVDDFTISNNTIYNCSNIAIDAAGGYAANSNPQLNYARNGVISGNVLYNIENSRGQLDGGFGAIAIYADGSRNITIERNRVFHCDRGIGIVSETDNFPTTGCIVRNNIVYDCWRTGIYMGGYLGYTGGGTEDCYVVNNTLYDNNRMEGAFGEIEGELRLTENCRNNRIANNLVVTTRPEDLFVHKYTATGSGNEFHNNLYSGPGSWMWENQDANAITDFEQWKATVGGDAEAIYKAEPMFDFAPEADAAFPIEGTEAKNNGKVLGIYFNGSTDFLGNPRIVDGAISIGAIQ